MPKNSSFVGTAAVGSVWRRTLTSGKHGGVCKCGIYALHEQGLLIVEGSQGCIEIRLTCWSHCSLVLIPNIPYFMKSHPLPSNAVRQSSGPQGLQVIWGLGTSRGVKAWGLGFWILWHLGDCAPVAPPPTLPRPSSRLRALGAMGMIQQSRSCNASCWHRPNPCH